MTPTGTWIEEFIRWFNEFRQGSYFYLESDHPAFGRSQYNHHVWSIAVEYRGSAIIYITTLVYFALGYGINARILAGIGLFCYFAFVVDGPYYALFAIGMLLCDLDLAWEHNPEQVYRWLKSTLLQRHNWICYVLLISGLYIGCPPQVDTAEFMATEPGWVLLSYFIPYTVGNARWFFTMYGAVRVSVRNLPMGFRAFADHVAMQFSPSVYSAFHASPG